MTTKKNIIIIKKVTSQGSHHSGAWKMAYADFVTAMMALFIVLWLLNTNDQVRKMVAGYFNDPRGKTAMTGTDRAGTSENLPALTKDNVLDLKKRIEQAIQKTVQQKGLTNQVEIMVTPEGLRIELLETKNGTFFETGSSLLNDNGKELLNLIAQQLKDIPNHLSIEGHTDSQPYADTSGYGNWELSTDRANAARRLMQGAGLRQDQISQVRGYADQKLRLPDIPLDPSNRRISLIVQYFEAAPDTVDSARSGMAKAVVSPPPTTSISIPAPPVANLPASTAQPVKAATVARISVVSRIAKQLLARLHRK